MIRIKKITQTGVNKITDKELKVHAIWLNKIAIFTLVTMVLYMVMHYLMGNRWITIAFDFIYILTPVLILYFNSKAQYRKAYYTVGIGYTLSFIFSSMLIGAQSQVEYLIFISTLGTILLFDEKRIRRLFFIFGFTTFVLLKIFHIYFPKGLLGVEFSPLFRIANGLIAFGIIYIIVDKAIIDTKIALSKLSKKHEEVNLLNATLEQKVEERTEEIQKKSKALTQSHKELKSFSYIAAHDMREPLRNIIGFSRLLNKDILKKEYDKIEEYSGYIDWAARRIDTITRGIVDYTNLEDLIEKRLINNLNEVVYQIVQAKFSKRQDVLLEIDNLPTVNVNTDLINMLFNQLIDNAIQYCDKPQPEIFIQCKAQQSNYLFSITDNGVGIPKEYHSKIFGMFKRLHNDYQKHGSGIGLSICKKIVESYGSKIWLESELGKGSTFYFTLAK